VERAELEKYPHPKRRYPRVRLQAKTDAYTARGTFMGNRGALHTEKREIVRQFNGQRWITCCLEFQGRKRTVIVS
jgi:hypothetical protein